MHERIVAVDLGGTSIKFGLIDQAGNMLDRFETPTPATDGPEAIVHKIATVIQMFRNKMKKEESIAAVGLGVPGYLNKETGVVTLAPNIGLVNYPIKKILEDLIPYPVYIDNDANLAALGEVWLGAGKKATQLIMVTLGTGVGGGIIVNGEILSGVNGIGGEIGHITVNPNGQVCGCGKRGCLETESSATAIKRKIITALEQGRESSLRHNWEETGTITVRTVVEAAEQGDMLSIEIFDEVAYYLGFALGALVNSLNPEKLLVGGGVSGAGELILKPLKKYLAQFSLPAALEVLQLEKATLGNDAGMIGAAYNALIQLQKHEQ